MKGKSARQPAGGRAGGAAARRGLLASGWGVAALALLSGVLAGGASPGGPLTGLWWLVYTPLFLGLDGLLAGHRSMTLRLWGRVLLLSWLVGVGQAWLSGGWISNTAQIYGHLPAVLAHGVNLLGFGSLLGFETCLFLAVPFTLARRRPGWGFFLVTLWSVVFQGLFPRFFYWTYGQFVHPVAELTQAADLVGSAGLNLLIIPLNLLLFAWLRELLHPGRLPRRGLAGASLALAVLFALTALYGHWRMAELTLAAESGAPLRLVGVQPNFSLGYLASNPALSHSQRVRNLLTLVEDTADAIERLPAGGSAPTLVVWPESVFPGRFSPQGRNGEAVSRWVRERGIHLVLTSITTSTDNEAAGQKSRAEGSRRKIYGSSLHLRPDQSAPEVYNKIALLPFGETIPFGRMIPAYRRLLKAMIPQISEFEAGEEHTVFEISPEIRLAPMICFDAVQDGIAGGMVRNGANLGLVLANLAWFGKTTITDLFEHYVRFQAIENRLPTLLLSQNGASVLLDAAGRAASRRLGLFEVDALSLRITVPETYSFYAHNSGSVKGLFALVLAALLVLPFFVKVRE